VGLTQQVAILAIQLDPGPGWGPQTLILSLSHHPPTILGPCCLYGRRLRGYWQLQAVNNANGVVRYATAIIVSGFSKFKEFVSWPRYFFHNMGTCITSTESRTGIEITSLFSVCVTQLASWHTPFGPRGLLHSFSKLLPIKLFKFHHIFTLLG
jgi:hypothetical protein